MNIELKKKMPIITIIASISTFILAWLSISNGESWILRILTQGGLSLTMLLSGFNYFVYRKRKVIGVFLLLVSAYLLFVMIATIYVGIQKNIF